MSHFVRRLTVDDAASGSELVKISFMALAASDWEAPARAALLAETSENALRRALDSPAYSAGAFDSHGAMVGFIHMPKPSLLGMLFVQPDSLRVGVATQLWEQARAHIEAFFPEVKTVELNSTPYALGFYRSVGFMPISAEFRRGGARATRMACWLPARALGAESL